MTNARQIEAARHEAEESLRAAAKQLADLKDVATHESGEWHEVLNAAEFDIACAQKAIAVARELLPK